MNFSIRYANTGDAAAITELSVQLGYDIDVNATIRNLQQIIDNTDHIAYVACDENIVIAWMQLMKTVRLESGQFCEIVGLVTDENYRSKGVGKCLLEEAVVWSKEMSCRRVVVRSNIKRTLAHSFYTANDFKEEKEQKIFEMNI